MFAVDGNSNRVNVRDLPFTLPTGQALMLASVVGEPGHGYVAAVEPDGGFGDEACPSSYGRPCLGWFGSGEAHPDRFSLLLELGAIVMAGPDDCPF